MGNQQLITPILVAVSDQALLEEVRRVAAAADREVSNITAPPPARSGQVTIVDADAAQRWGRSAGVDVVVCSQEPTLHEWRAAAQCGAGQVIGLPDGGPSLLRLIASRSTRTATYGCVIAVCGVRGGAGASVFSAALGLEAAKANNPVLLLDGDGSGAGLDLLLGIEDRPGVRWSGLVLEDGRVSAAALRAALPHTGDDLAVLSCARGETDAPPIESVVSVASECATSGDIVVCDLSKRSAADAAQVARIADLTVLIVPAELRSVAAARAVIPVLREADGQIGAVLRGPSPGGLRAADIAPLLGIPVLVAMRPQPRLNAQLERGRLRLNRRGPLTAAAGTVLATAYRGMEAVAG